MTLPDFAPSLEDDLFVPFWKAFERHEVVMTRCNAFHRVQWHPDRTGLQCDCERYESVQVAATGVVRSHPQVYRPVEAGDVSAVPFLVACVDGDGARLVANLDETNAPITIGTLVEALFVELAHRGGPAFQVVAA
jgi:uncharacterized OB-fold protein